MDILGNNAFYPLLLAEHFSAAYLPFSDFIKVDIFVLKVATEASDLKMDANSCSTHMGF